MGDQAFQAQAGDRQALGKVASLVGQVGQHGQGDAGRAVFGELTPVGVYSNSGHRLFTSRCVQWVSRRARGERRSASLRRKKPNWRLRRTR